MMTVFEITEQELESTLGQIRVDPREFDYLRLTYRWPLRDARTSQCLLLGIGRRLDIRNFWSDILAKYTVDLK